MIGGALRTAGGPALAATCAALFAGCGARTGLRIEPPLPTPRALAPLSTSRVTTQAPVLRWLPAEGSDATRVEICATPDCASPAQSLDIAGDRVSPSAPLAPGVWFWRLRALRGGVAFAGVSPTWEFFVGHHHDAHATSWGTTLDLNRDGLADVAASTEGEAFGDPGALEIHLAEPGGVSAASALSLSGLRYSCPIAEWTISSAGDVNGDGYGDLGIVVHGAGGTGDAVEIYFGGRTGPSSSPDQILRLPPDELRVDTGMCRTVQAVGDLNGDGYADLVTNALHVWLFVGGPDGLTVATRAPFYTPPPNQYEPILWALGDVDGDEIGDFVIDEGLGQLDRSGGVSVYLGEASLASPVPAAHIPFGPFPPIVEAGRPDAAGDLNGDGLADLGIARHRYVEQTDRVLIYCGERGGVGVVACDTLDGVSLGWRAFFVRPAYPGDLDGDGFDDVVIPNDDEGSGVGGVIAYRGGATGLTPAPASRLRDPGGGFLGFGGYVARLGDVDGDTLADVLILQCTAHRAQCRTLVYRGARGGLDPEPYAQFVLTMR